MKAQNADEIMGKYLSATGGEEGWNKVKTLKMIGSMSQQGMDITITQTVRVGEAMRMDINVAGMNGWQIVTKTGGWMYMPFMGAAKIDTMKPDMAKAAQKQMDFKSSRMLDYKSNGSKLEYTGRDTISSAPCYKIKVTDKEGNEVTSFIDCSTYYLLRTEAKVKQDEQETEVAVAYNNYKKFDEGVVLPMTIIAQGAEITFKTVEINKPIDDKVFIPSMDTDKPKDGNKESANSPDQKQTTPASEGNGVKK